MNSVRNCLAALVCLATLTRGETVQARAIPFPPPGPTRIANANVVIVGKVEKMEPADVKVGDTTYRIAVVRISEGLKGTTNEQALRVGFVPLGMDPVYPDSPQLTVGHEGLFILTKRDKENFFTFLSVLGYYIDRDKNKDFEKEVRAAKAALKVINNPRAALKATDATERIVAAAILVEEYRSSPRPNSKQEPIDEQESKQILQVIADADWAGEWNPICVRPYPGHLFQRLGISTNEGFAAPAVGNYQTAVQAWVHENAQKYRIRRFVPSKKT